MSRHAYCDGVRRRDFLKAGIVGAGGLSLAGLLAMEARGEVAAADRGKNAIFVYLPGGQSHLDSFDLKPDSKDKDVRGEFKPIDTVVPGLQICELLPKLALQVDKLTVLRSVCHTLAAHAPGQQYMRSGNRPIPSLEYPNYGSVVCKEFTAPRGIPPYVSLPINRSNGGVETPGYLGVQYSSFAVSDDPNDDDFSVRALAMPGGLTLKRVEARMELMQNLDTTLRDDRLRSQQLEGMDKFYQQAADILRSSAAREAFDLAGADDKVRDRYGRNSFGQACLLARRLVEAGVRCVAIDYGSWDTHRKNFEELRAKLPVYDQGMASLIEDLYESGLLDNTVVWSTGEFGRTPKVNGNAGRDHWARAMSMLMAGGDIARGKVVGATDENGAEPTTEPYLPDDAAATFFAALGIDSQKEYHTSSGRPVMVLRNGQPIEEAFG